MFNYHTERELHNHLIKHFNDFFQCEFLSSEVTFKGGRIDLLGIMDEVLYIIELKRDIVSNNTIKQLRTYLDRYEPGKKKIGIAAAPGIDSEIDISVLDNDIKILKLIDVNWSLKEDTQSTTVVLDKVVNEKLKKIAKECKRSASGQMAFIIEKFIDEYELKNK